MFSLYSIAPIRQENGDAGDAPAAASEEQDKHQKNVDGMYIVSAAVDDRHINAFQVDYSSDKNSGKAIGTFLLPEEPVFVQVSQPRIKGQVRHGIIAYHIGSQQFIPKF